MVELSLSSRCGETDITGQTCEKCMFAKQNVGVDEGNDEHESSSDSNPGEVNEVDDVRVQTIYSIASLSSGLISNAGGR